MGLEKLVKIQPEVVIPLGGESVMRFAQIFSSGHGKTLCEWALTTVHGSRLRCIGDKLSLFGSCQEVFRELLKKNWSEPRCCSGKGAVINLTFMFSLLFNNTSILIFRCSEILNGVSCLIPESF